MSYNEDLQSNNAKLQAILRTVNELPDASGGGGGGRATHRGKIITIWEHTFDEDVADSTTFDDGTADQVIGRAKVYTTDENGNPLKIRRMWHEIYWGAGSKEAASSSYPPFVGIGNGKGVNLREMFLQNLHQQRCIRADRGSKDNNIGDGQYRYGYVDWEKIEGVEYHANNAGWRGNFNVNNCYPTADQVRFALTAEYADFVCVSLPSTVKAGTKYKVWVEVSE